MGKSRSKIRIVRAPRRTTYVCRDGKLIEKHLAPPRHAAAAAPHVISDTVAPFKHMATGRIVDSKSQARAMTRAAGCVEVGTDPAASRPRPRPAPPSLVPYVQRAIAKLESR